MIDIEPLREALLRLEQAYADPNATVPVPVNGTVAEINALKDRVKKTCAPIRPKTPAPK